MSSSFTQAISSRLRRVNSLLKTGNGSLETDHGFVKGVSSFQQTICNFLRTFSLYLAQIVGLRANLLCPQSEFRNLLAKFVNLRSQLGSYIRVGRLVTDFLSLAANFLCAVT